jgi:hypothetical protein
METHSDSEIFPAREQTTEELEEHSFQQNKSIKLKHKTGSGGGGFRSMNAGGGSEV